MFIQAGQSDSCAFAIKSKAPTYPYVTKTLNHIFIPTILSSTLWNYCGLARRDHTVIFPDPQRLLPLILCFPSFSPLSLTFRISFRNPNAFISSFLHSLSRSLLIRIRPYHQSPIPLVTGPLSSPCSCCTSIWKSLTMSSQPFQFNTSSSPI